MKRLLNDPRWLLGSLLALFLAARLFIALSERPGPPSAGVSPLNTPGETTAPAPDYVFRPLIVYPGADGQMHATPVPVADNRLVAPMPNVGGGFH